MKLETKRLVIEVLMCASSSWARSPGNSIGIAMASVEVGLLAEVACHTLHRSATRARYRTLPVTNGLSYADSCLEAAYRLIESSATLRREWFGDEAGLPAGLTEFTYDGCVVIGCPDGSVTIDFSDRCFRAGTVARGPADSSKSYGGHRWRERLRADAISWLQDQIGAS